MARRASIRLSVTARAALSQLPVLRKSELMEFQADEPAFRRLRRSGRTCVAAGFSCRPARCGNRKARASIRGRRARAFFAAGIRAGDIVHNAFSYHMTPGGFILDEGARALGCTVFPAGTGNTDMQVEAAAALKPGVYCGTPDFLKVMLDRAAESGKDLSSLQAWRWCRAARCFRRCAPNTCRAASRFCNATPPPSSASSPMRARRRTAGPIPA